MRRDHKPYSMRLLVNFMRRLYTRWRLHPQFAAVGSGLEVIGPHRLEIWGDDIHLGDNVHIQTSRGQMSRLCTWPNESGGRGRIDIGSHTLLTPGLQIVSADHVSIGDNVMIASRVYISDADWHEIYDRLASPGPRAPVHIGENVWLGEGVKVCKGVTIGANSVIGAGSVVTKDIPANVIAAGNPAKPVRELEKDRSIKKREAMFENIKDYHKTMRYLHYLNHKGNSFIGWIRQIILPSRKG
jgi:acetyltransferase-like isoleucine patch superfamily enzyme